MVNQSSIVEKLSQFNNMSFTKKQWDIILKGCDCPKSVYFWISLKNICIVKTNALFTMKLEDTNTLNKVFTMYRDLNRLAVNKYAAKKKAREKVNNLKGITLFMVGGVLTTERPKRD